MPLIEKATSIEVAQRGVDGTRTRDQGFADLCLTSLATTPCLKKAERAMGFEPTTFSLARRRSTTELHPHKTTWQGRPDLNRQPTVLETVALPA